MVFKTTAIDHSAIPPRRNVARIRGFHNHQPARTVMCHRKCHHRRHTGSRRTAAIVALIAAPHHGDKAHFAARGLQSASKSVGFNLWRQIVGGASAHLSTAAYAQLPPNNALGAACEREAQREALDV